MMTCDFQQFGLDPSILQALEKMQFKAPSPVQARTIPLVMEGKDVMALAQTGSGKTAACAIPICQRVDTERGCVQVLIIVPTRELALQYATEVQKIGVYRKVKAFAIYGGQDAAMQMSKLNHGVQVLVATPGRLIDFIYSRQIDLSHVETLVLDEADEMLSMGFCDDLEFIIQCLVHDHQTLLFSATMPALIKTIAKRHMKDPVELSLISLDVSPSSTEHLFVYCRQHEKDRALAKLVEDLRPKQGIVFCRSRQECEKVARALQQEVGMVDFFHAGLTQEVRTALTGKFRSGKIRLLVATDVVSRGLDFSNVSHVFIYHLSDDPDAYVHRSGRTGRFDKEGAVISLVTDRELPHLKDVLHRIQREPIWIGEPPPAKPQRSRAPAYRSR